MHKLALVVGAMIERRTPNTLELANLLPLETERLSLDQTELVDRMAVLMVYLRIEDRSLPLAWTAEAGAVNIGFAQRVGTGIRVSTDRPQLLELPKTLPQRRVLDHPKAASPEAVSAK